MATLLQSQQVDLCELKAILEQVPGKPELQSKTLSVKEIMMKIKESYLSVSLLSASSSCLELLPQLPSSMMHYNLDTKVNPFTPQLLLKQQPTL